MSETKPTPDVSRYYSESKREWLVIAEMPYPHLVNAKNKMEARAVGEPLTDEEGEILDALSDEIARREAQGVG